MSTLSRSASTFASGRGRTSDPMMIACEAAARFTSDSVIAPTPVWMIRRRTSVCSTFSSASTKAPTEPCTSPLTMMLSSLSPPSLMRKTGHRARRVRGGSPTFGAQPLTALAGHRRAVRSFSTMRNLSPASGTPESPRTSAGIDGGGLDHGVADEAVHRADAAVLLAGQNDVAHMQRAAHYEHVQTGPRRGRGAIR